MSLTAFNRMRRARAENVAKALNEEVAIEVKSFKSMTIPELKDYATKNAIDLKVAKKRDDILEAIQLARTENPPKE